MNRRTLILLALASCVAACKEEAEPTDPEIRRVRTVVVERTRIDNSAIAVGDIHPQRDIDLSFRVSGKLTERLVDVGDPFVAGDLLARLDAEDYVQRLESAKGDLAAAKAVLVEATAQEGRTRKLFTDGFATRVQFDGTIKSLHSASAKVESASAALKLAEAQLAYTEIRAEFDGIVTATGAEEGQVVNVGQLIFRTAEPDLRDAVFDVADAAFFPVPDAGADTPVRVTLLGHPEIFTTGQIREVAPLADAATRTYEVRVSLANPPAEMRFGASVNGRLDVVAPEVVVLPASALFDDAGDPAVWVVQPVSSTLQLIPIDVARYEADRIVVAGGLDDGDIVVTAGVHQLRENQKVTLTESAEK